MPERKIDSAYKDLQERELYVLTEFFKLLGNPTRIHILFLLRLTLRDGANPLVRVVCARREESIAHADLVFNEHGALAGPSAVL